MVVHDFLLRLASFNPPIDFREVAVEQIESLLNVEPLLLVVSQFDDLSFDFSFNSGDLILALRDCP